MYVTRIYHQTSPTPASWYCNAATPDGKLRTSSGPKGKYMMNRRTQGSWGLTGSGGSNLLQRNVLCYYVFRLVRIFLTLSPLRIVALAPSRWATSSPLRQNRVITDVSENQDDLEWHIFYASFILWLRMLKEVPPHASYLSDITPCSSIRSKLGISVLLNLLLRSNFGKHTIWFFVSQELKLLFRFVNFTWWNAIVVRRVCRYIFYGKQVLHYVVWEIDIPANARCNSLAII